MQKKFWSIKICSIAPKISGRSLDLVLIRVLIRFLNEIFNIYFGWCIYESSKNVHLCY